MNNHSTRTTRLARLVIFPALLGLCLVTARAAEEKEAPPAPPPPDAKTETDPPPGPPEIRPRFRNREDKQRHSPLAQRRNAPHGRSEGPPSPDAPPPLEALDLDLEKLDNLKGHQLATLDRFLAMPPEKLTAIRQTLETIEALSPEERQAMRERIRSFRQMQPERRRAMMQRIQRMKPEQRQRLRTFWQGLSPEEKQNLHGKLRDLSPHERRNLRERILKGNPPFPPEDNKQEKPTAEPGENPPSSSED